VELGRARMSRKDGAIRTCPGVGSLRVEGFEASLDESRCSLAGGQGHEAHPFSPVAGSDAAQYAARVVQDAAHRVEDQKPQPFGPSGEIGFR
jgi:hypothetical protein